MDCLEVSRRVLGLPVRAGITRLAKGLNVLLTGGSRTHVGAVSLAVPGAAVQTMEAAGHRDAAVSEAWAATLCGRLGIPVCVECGIHYDSATAEQIREILSACDKLLGDVMDRLL